MTDDNVKTPERRIVLKVPAYMPKLKEELAKYPENCHGKRLLVLAAIGLAAENGQMSFEAAQQPDTNGSSENGLVSIDLDGAAETVEEEVKPPPLPVIDTPALSLVLAPAEAALAALPETKELPPQAPVPSPVSRPAEVVAASPGSSGGKARRKSNGLKIT